MAPLPAVPPRSMPEYWRSLDAKRRYESKAPGFADMMRGLFTTPDFGALGTESQQPFFSGADTSYGFYGADLYVAALVRTSTCSLNELVLGPPTSSYEPTSLLQTIPNYEQYLHTISGLSTKVDVFAKGCPTATVAGKLGQGIYLGTTKSGDQVGAGYDHIDGPLFTIFVTSGNTKLVSQTTVEVGNQVIGLLAADFNGDGYLDIAVLSQSEDGSTNNLGIMTNNGDGTFAAPVLISLPEYPTGVVAGNFGSGHTDLVVTTEAASGSSITGSLLYYKNPGTGVFGSPVTTNLGSIADVVITPADVNNDGKLDIAGFQLAAAGAYSFVELLGQGNGTFTAKVGTPQPYLGDVGIGDLNGDGVPDMTITDAYSQQLQVYKGNGDGTFTKQVTLPTLNDPTSTYITDMDGDGVADIVMGYANGTAFGPTTGSFGEVFGQVLIGKGNFTYSTPGELHALSGILQGGTKGFAVADFNGDSKQDVAALASVTSAETTYLNVFTYLNASGVLTNGSASAFGLEPVQDSALMDIADFNGDGKQDVVLAGFDPGDSGSAIQAGIGDGTGKFTAKKILDVAGMVTGLVTGEFSGTTKAGIAYTVNSTSGTGSGLYTAAGNGDGTFATPVLVDGSVSTPVTLLAADVNDDGRPDLVVVQGNGFNASTISVYLNNGNGTFAKPVSFTPPNNASVTDIIAADFNGDGKLDLGMAGFDADAFATTFYVFAGNNSATFTYLSATDISNQGAVSIAAIDVNHDGHLDIVTDGCCGAATPLEIIGKGDGTFYPAEAFVVPQNVSGVRPISLSGTVYPDIIFGAPEEGAASAVIVPVLNHYAAAPSVSRSATEITSAGGGTTEQGGYVDVTVTVKETGAAGAPTGTVTGTISGDPSLTATLQLTGGQAEFYFQLPNNFSVGAGTLNISYSGDLYNSPSSGTASFNVEYQTAVAFTASTTSVPYDGNISLTGKVTRPYGTGSPTGEVSFFYKGGNAFLANVPLVNGVATLSANTTGYPAGIYDVEAYYYGDKQDADSVGVPMDIYITLVPKGDVGTTTSLNISPTAGPAGGNFTVTVNVAESGSSSKPNGSVTIYEYSTALATLPVTNGKAVATLQVPNTLYPDNYTITAIYSGSGNVYRSESSPVEFSVLNSTTTSLDLSSSTVTQGQSVTITGYISQYTSYFDIIGGTLTILANGVAVATVPVSNGVGSFTASTAGIPKGTYSVTGRYGGDANNAPSTSPAVPITVQ